MMTSLDNVTIMVGGKPLARARVEVGDRRESLEFASAATLGTYRFTARCEGTGSIGAFTAHRPVESPAVTMTVPWSILGKIEVRAWVDDSRLTKNGEGTAVTLGMTADDKALARAVSMAVEKAIVHRPTGVGAVNCALLGDSDLLKQLADTVLRKRAARKKRRAMRRLLRAAGTMLRPITINPIPVGADRVFHKYAAFHDAEIRRALGGS
jgi:hypothetical protein